MSLFSVLFDLGLICWSTVYLGFRRRWVKRDDVFEYAISLLVNGSECEMVAIIAGGEYLSDEELLELILMQVDKTDCDADIDKWRLAFLLYIETSGGSDENKINSLQEVYADFGYPEDMASCSIYSQDDDCPLVAMNQVIEKLKERFLPR